MALKKWTFTVEKTTRGLRLDDFLYQKLAAEKVISDFTRGHARKWIIEGKVELNRRRLALPGRILAEGEVVEFFYDSGKKSAPNFADPSSGTKGSNAAPAPGEYLFSLTDIPIIYEDEDLLVVSKPAGLPTQPTLDPDRVNLYELLKTKPGLNYVGLHHRLDRDTSGVIVFTKRKEANLGVANAFKNRDAKKIYLSIVEIREKPLPRGTWVVENFLKRDDRKGARKDRPMRSVKSGGDTAKTSFQILSLGSRAALLACAPHTGRMHQIRVHLSEAGYPIIGDSTYGSALSGRVMLHAAHLTLSHPITNLTSSFTAPLPADFLECLSVFQLSVSTVPKSLEALFPIMPDSIEQPPKLTLKPHKS